MARAAQFDCGFVQPNDISNQRLSTGIYSLSSRSNVPYVKLEGQNLNKVFSWGEIVEVGVGQQVTVRNASYHAGDIIINGGCEYDNRPPRITVPVAYSSVAALWTPAYPCDVRMAKRAYIGIDASLATVADSILGEVRGIRFDGSHNTQNEPTSFGPLVGSGYSDLFALTGPMSFGLIPLGHLSEMGDDTRPHILLTTAAFYFDDNAAVTLTVTPPNAYYTLEY